MKEEYSDEELEKQLNTSKNDCCGFIFNKMCRDCDGFGVKMSILDLIDKVANVYT
jgi:hypothetical protein